MASNQTPDGIAELVTALQSEAEEHMEGCRLLLTVHPNVPLLRHAAEALTRLEQAEATVARLITVAGEAIGTHPEMRSEGCIDALAGAYDFALRSLAESRSETGRLIVDRAEATLKAHDDGYEQGRLAGLGVGQTKREAADGGYISAVTETARYKVRMGTLAGLLREAVEAMFTKGNKANVAARIDSALAAIEAETGGKG